MSLDSCSLSSDHAGDCLPLLTHHVDSLRKSQNEEMGFRCLALFASCWEAAYQTSPSEVGKISMGHSFKHN